MLIEGDVQEIVQRLQPTRRIAIRTAGPMNGLQEALEAMPDIVKVAPEPNSPDTAIIDLQGDIIRQAEILRSLVDSGHKICSFTETAFDLEDVFMRVTTGKVQ